MFVRIVASGRLDQRRFGEPCRLDNGWQFVLALQKEVMPGGGSSTWSVKANAAVGLLVSFAAAGWAETSTVAASRDSDIVETARARSVT